MRVIVAHTENFATPALKALLLYAPDVEFIETKGLYGYNEAIASRWDGSDGLAVIEQDKEITAEVLPSFEQCDRPWCVYHYDIFPMPYTKQTVLGLGCTRYSAEAQKIIAVDDFIRPDYDFWPKCRRCDGKGCWAYLDARIGMALMGKGIEPHIHGKVVHHHEYPSAGKWLEGIAENFEGQVGTMADCPACGSALEKQDTRWKCIRCECAFAQPFYVR